MSASAGLAGQDRQAGTLLSGASARLGANGLAEARREARILLAEVMAVAPEHLFAHPETPVGESQRAAFESLVARRLKGEPLSRILGRREFWSLPFRLCPATLDPRPDSETLIEAALGHVADRAAPLNVLDFGTGSGCLLLALLSELPRARGLGIDISAQALETAAENARGLGLANRVAFLASDWDSALTGAENSRLWDVILCNPPYVDHASLGNLDPEVADYDPRRALDGGAEGLEAYRRLMPAFARLLATGGFAVVELGAGQAEAVSALAEATGLRVVEGASDLAGWTRALVLRRGGIDQ
jgi:release factor glutamine methyltransferase